MKAPIVLPMKLDDSQKAFCMMNDKYIRLLAPAGAGKTLTLLHRCKRLIEKNPQEKILLFTFTRVARDELKARVKTNPDFKSCSANIHISTLNSYGLRIVKNKSSLQSSYKTIEKKERIWAVVNYLMPVMSKSKTLETKMKDKRWRAFNASKVLDMIDMFKSLGFDHDVLKSESDFRIFWDDLAQTGLKPKLASIEEDLQRLGLIKKPYEIYGNFFKFYVAATNHLKSMNLFTMEDQKYWGWKYSESGAKLTGAARYTHIMVDEFQDINPIDLMFIKAIRNQHDASLVIVGDDDQAIFEWRGATPQYILNPDKFFSSIRYPLKFATCVLDKNYRSPKNIVDMAQKLIRNNENRVDKNTKAIRSDMASVQIKMAPTYDYVVNEIMTIWNNSAIKNIAVITRKRSQLIPYQILFASKQIPFFAAEDLNVFLTEAFNSLKDLIEIKQVHKEGRVPSFLYYNEAVIKLCDRIRKYPLNKAERDDVHNHMCMAPCSSLEDAVDQLCKMPTIKKIMKDVDLYEILFGFLGTDTVASMLEYVGDHFAGLQKDMHKADDDIFYTDPPFAELAEFSRRYDSDFDRFYFDIQKAISTLATLSKQEDDELTDEEIKKLNTKLHLMTSLRTKGKEFDAVFVLAANANVWPIRFARTKEDLEAERRLFYVAVTRARKELQFMLYDDVPSPYLHELGLQ